MTNSRNTGGGGCGCFLMILIFNLLLGGLAFQYSLKTVFNRDVPWYTDVVCGLFLGEIVVPAAIVCYIVKNVADVPAPFIQR